MDSLRTAALAQRKACCRRTFASRKIFCSAQVTWQRDQLRFFHRNFRTKASEQRKCHSLSSLLSKISDAKCMMYPIMRVRIMVMFRGAVDTRRRFKTLQMCSTTSGYICYISAFCECSACMTQRATHQNSESCRLTARWMSLCKSPVNLLFLDKTVRYDQIAPV